ncbi:MAG TPA: hypothetical protein VGU74_15075 [Gemmatimonadales bacterium]|nr:hypothetical protein [Gemmatimonadales bacterium]
MTAGAQMSHLLGPGVRMALDGGLMFGPQFSGGGSISALGAVRLGLGVTVDALHGRARFTGDYEFQSVSRTTDDGSGSVPAPIQQSLGRIGLAIAFRPVFSGGLDRPGPTRRLPRPHDFVRAAAPVPGPAPEP